MHPRNRKKIKIKKVGKQRRGESGIGERVLHDLFIVSTSISLLLIARNKKRSPF